jgi:hypothetical protein
LQKYDASAVTATDRLKTEEAKGLMHDWWMQRMNPNAGWTDMKEQSGEPLGMGVSGVSQYSAARRCGEGVAHCIVNATPEQCMGYVRASVASA